jgi:hypothetical protein
MISRTRLLISFLLLQSASILNAQAPAPAGVSQELLLGHIRYLASEGLKGRKSGEEGNRLAAAYIASRFKEYGLSAPPQTVAAGTPYLQDFTFVTSRKPGKKNSLRITAGAMTASFSQGEDFKPLSFSADTSVTAPLAFVGYGISAHDSVQYDDYAGVSVRGKIVVMMRYSPDGPGDHRFTRFMSFIDKAMTARDSGASGVIFLTAPPGSEGSDLSSVPSDVAYSGTPLPVVALAWNRMESILASSGKELRSIQRQIDSAKSPVSFDAAGTTVSMETQILREYAHTANIVGYLPGSGSDECVVLGAHMDHLGMGGQGSGSLKPDTVAIHPGADDNASGTSALLEAARYFSTRRSSLKRTLVFAAFSGEELGLLGSSYYVRNPLWPLEKTTAMLNMDMVGRMKDSVLVVEGMGTSPRWESLVKSENSDSLALKLKPDGFGPSDHSSFYAKDIPVLFFFTNLHSDYHRPSDTWDKINYAGERRVVEFVTRIASEIDSESARPPFTKAVASAPMSGGGDRQGLRVSLGVIPDYAEDVHGLKITGTRAGSPADKAGLKADDIIIRLDGKEVTNIYDYMHVLGAFKPGDEVTVVVRRGKEERSLRALLEARK